MEILKQNWIIIVIIAFMGWKFFKTMRTKKLLGKMMQNENQIIDVRSPAEYESGHDPRAINIPLDSIKNQTDKIRRDVPVILVCQSGSRSGMASMLLKGMGYSNITNGGNWQNTLVDQSV